MSHPAGGNALHAVLFDLDGTLVDTADDFIPVVQTLRAENALPPLEPAQIRSQVSNGARALVHLALGLEEQDPGFAHWRQRLLELYGAVVGRQAQVYSPLRELLQRFEAGGIRWGIATNKPRRYTEALLQALDLRPAPGTVVCADDVIESKPHPAMLQRALAELETAAAQSVYVGDHPRDVEAGRRAGMRTVAVGYGYLGEHEHIERWGADAVVATPQALVQLLDTLTGRADNTAAAPDRGLAGGSLAHRAGSAGIAGTDH